jgi:D-inositol-3-phosphate glycosyltransferase
MIEKRIGIIMYQTSNSKGQELVAQRMVRDFLKLGQKAYLITSTYHDGTEITTREGLIKNKGYYYVQDEVLNIPVIRVESSLAKWPPRRIVFKDFISTLNQIVDDFNLNVLITHSTLWNGPEETAKFVAWRRDMRKIGGYQDPIVFCHMSHFQEPSAQRYSLSELTYRTAWNKISLSKILETANLVLVVTPYEKKAKVDMGAKLEKCLLYPGGVDSEVFLKFAADDTTEFLKRHNIPQGKRLISYLGTLEERKNPLAVIKIAQHLADQPQLHFVLAGRGDSSYGREIVKLANNLTNVSYIGEIDEREKVALIRASFLNILMSRLEALGISQLEFMYGGVPVVTSGVGGQAWVVQNGLEGLHTKGPGDIEGAVNSIMRLVDDERLYRQMSVNAKDRAASYASINLTGVLDTSINRELIKESGLSSIPADMQETLTRPEYVLKSWSGGTAGIVATNRRIFFRRGVISQSVLGMRYQNIKAIEHMRRYLWKAPIVGAILSCLAFFTPSFQNWLAPGVVNSVKLLMNKLGDLVPPQLVPDGWLFPTLVSLPFLISLIIFFLNARTGFRLYGEGMKPIYIPGKFRKSIKFIREIQDKDFGSVNTEGSELHQDKINAMVDSIR